MLNLFLPSGGAIGYVTDSRFISHPPRSSTQMANNSRPPRSPLSAQLPLRQSVAKSSGCLTKLIFSPRQRIGRRNNPKGKFAASRWSRADLVLQALQNAQGLFGIGHTARLFNELASIGQGLLGF